MTIKFYTLASICSFAKLNKTAYLTPYSYTGFIEMNITLKDGCDVINPIIVIRGADFPAFNYCQVVEFNRYYFVTDVASVRNGVWEISLHVDVLFTYLEHLNNTCAYVERTQGGSNRNLLIPDDLISFSNELDISEYTLGTLPFPDYRVGEAFPETKLYMVILTTSNITPQGSSSVVANTMYLKQTPYLYVPYTNANIVVHMTRTELFNFLNLAIDDTQLSSAIRRIYFTSYIPSAVFLSKIKITSTGEYINNGYEYTIISPNNPYLSTVFSNVYLPPKYTDTRTFLDYAPYSEYRVYLPFYGVFNLSNNYVGRNINLQAVIDLPNGEITYQFSTVDNVILDTVKGNFGVLIPFSQSNVDVNDKQRELNIFNSVVDGLSSLTNLGIGLLRLSEPSTMVSGASMAIQGSFNAASAPVKAFYTNATYIDRVTSSTSSYNLASLTYPTDIRLYVIRKVPVDETWYDAGSHFSRSYGNVVSKVVRIGSCSGTTICNPSKYFQLTGEPMLSTEYDEILSILSTGFQV